MDTLLAGLKNSYAMAASALPGLLLGFILAGLASVLIPKSFVVDHMGAQSGVSGLAIGTLMGIGIPGVTSTIFPIVALMIQMGVGVGPLVAYLSAWGLVQAQRLIVWEIPFLGMKLALTRFVLCLALPPVIGALCSFYITEAK
jgi:uncharacterized membrane protein YraQ (UPF0718 family)